MEKYVIYDIDNDIIEWDRTTSMTKKEARRLNQNLRKEGLDKRWILARLFTKED